MISHEIDTRYDDIPTPITFMKTNHLALESNGW